MAMDADLLVVGSGVVGSFAALHAARVGAKVILVERDDWPRSASTWNFGMAIPSGMELGPAHRHAEASVELYRALAEAGALTITGAGTVYCATTMLEAQVLSEMADRAPGLGYRCALLPAELLRSSGLPLGPDVIAGLQFPGDVQVDQRTLGRTMIPWMTEQFNVTYLPNTTVTSLQSSEGVITISTSTGTTLAAARAMVCAGPELQVLFPEVFQDAGVQLCKLQMVRTKAGSPTLPHAVASGWSLRRYGSFGIAPSRVALRDQPIPDDLRRNGIHVLIKPEADGSLTIGDSHHYSPSEEAASDRIDADVERAILREAARLVPDADLEVAERWIGRYPVFPEGEWLTKHPAPGIAVLSFAGAGMTLAPSLTRGVVSDLLES